MEGYTNKYSTRCYVVVKNNFELIVITPLSTYFFYKHGSNSYDVVKPRAQFIEDISGKEYYKYYFDNILRNVTHDEVLDLIDCMPYDIKDKVKRWIRGVI